MESKKKCFTGNFSFSRATSTASSDYRIVESDGRMYFYRHEFSVDEKVSTLKPTNILSESEILWEDIPLSIREMHFHTIFPNGTTDEEKILFLYGKEEGNKILNDKWADTHIIVSKMVTMEIISQIGRFNSSKRIRSSMYENTRIDQYLIDEKWQANIVFAPDGFHKVSIELYGSSKRTEYGKRIRSMCDKLDIPWRIGSLVGDIEDDKEALAILRKIKSLRDYASKNHYDDLTSTSLYHVKDTLIKLLGPTIFFKLKCKGRKNAYDLADYLAKITN